MVQPTEKVIDGKTVKVMPFFAVRANTLKFKILGLFGASLLQIVGKLFSSLKDGSKIADLDISELVPAFESVLEKHSPEVFQKTLEEILASTWVDGKGVSNSFDDIFTGEYSFMYKCVGFALWVNYKSFFGKVDFGSILKGAQAETMATVAKSTM
jgi:hypothetical protein